MVPPLKVALVGCGRISKKHVEVIKSSPNLELVGVCDVDRARASALSAKAAAPAFFDALEMVKKLRPDIVSVLTPSGSHARVTCELVPYVKNVVVEKPMALTLEDADLMIETCAHARVGLFIVKQNRYNTPVLRARQALEQGRFGDLALGTVRVRWCRDQAYYDQDAWRGTWQDDGGVFTNQASHHIDLLQWMMGPVESVNAYTATRLVDIEVEDVGVAILRFTSGALGVVEATTATRPSDLEGSLSLLGEKGSVVISGFAVNKMETWQFSDEHPDDEQIQRVCVNLPNVYGFGHIAFYEDVVRCIQNQCQAPIDGGEGRKSLELIVAMYEAATTRQEVRVRYVPKNVRLGHIWDATWAGRRD
jgi:UDP-N-acetyl-2-amino-2-deoxyglucuronate dehydrogenase